MEELACAPDSLAAASSVPVVSGSSGVTSTSNNIVTPRVVFTGLNPGAVRRLTEVSVFALSAGNTGTMTLVNGAMFE